MLSVLEQRNTLQEAGTDTDSPSTSVLLVFQSVSCDVLAHCIHESTLAKSVR
jgi:hypothetical protein